LEKKRKPQREETENTEIYKTANEVLIGKRFFLLSHTTETRKHSMRLPFIGFKTNKKKPQTQELFLHTLWDSSHGRSYGYKLFKRSGQIHRRRVQHDLNVTVSTHPLAGASSEPVTAGRRAERWLPRSPCTLSRFPPTIYFWPLSPATRWAPRASCSPYYPITHLLR